MESRFLEFYQVAAQDVVTRAASARKTKAKAASSANHASRNTNHADAYGYSDYSSYNAGNGHSHGCGSSGGGDAFSEKYKDAKKHKKSAADRGSEKSGGH